MGADRCPGSVVLHAAQDGWLARVRVPGGRLSATQLAALADAAALGSGLVELTARANLQLRGLPDGAGARLATLLREAGLLPSVAHDRARNIVASPLAGRHPRSLTVTDAVVTELDRRLCADPALAELPGRFLFAVDDGSGLPLGREADVALVSVDDGSYALALAGQVTEPGARHAPSPPQPPEGAPPRVPSAPHAAAAGGGAPPHVPSAAAIPLDGASAARVAVTAARAFLAERAATGERAWRIAELAGGAGAVARRLGMSLVGPLDRARGAAVPGGLDQRDGRRALTVLVPLGCLDAGVLAALAALGGEVRLSTERTLTLVDLEPVAAGRAQRAVTELGLVVEDGSGWVGLTACAGAGRCAKARADVRAAAAGRAPVRRRGAPAEHWAACERRCGERAEQALAVTARADGVTIRRNGDEHVVADLDQALAVLA